MTTTNMLTVDAVSASTLPHLDSLYAGRDHDVLRDLLENTPAPALRRLLLASIARHTHLAPASLKIPSARATLLEGLIKLNLSGEADGISEVVDELGVDGSASLIFVSLARYHVVGGLGRVTR
jgi:hypothetical protein